jgi:hypothetical protein
MRFAMPAQVVRILLVLLLSWSLTECPGQARAAAGSSLDEAAVTVNEEAATISLRYREQIAKQIEALQPGSCYSEALFLPQPALVACGAPHGNRVRIVPGAPSVYELMSLLR